MQTRGQKKRKFNLEIIKHLPIDDPFYTLHTLGYQIFKDHMKISDTQRNYLIKLINNYGTCIFNHNEKSRKNDRKRIRVNIRSTFYSKHVDSFMDEFKTVLNSFFPHLTMNDPVVLGSKIGCKLQAAHIDYPPNGIQNHCHVPINAILALQDETYLNVWPESHHLIAFERTKDSDELDQNYDPMIPPIRMQRIQINEGDLLLFRGDLVHAGAQYHHKPNYRIHCFMDYDHRIPNRTWLIDKHGSDYLRNMILID